MVNFFKRKKQIKGIIGYFDLDDWWLSTFSEEEQQHIQKTFQPLGSNGESLITSDITFTTSSSISYLYTLSGWFNNKEDRHIAYKILNKAEELVSEKTKTLDLHFLYSNQIDLFYKDRDKLEYYEKSVSACLKQINLADKAKKSFIEKYSNSTLPSHRGYKQLSIILEKEKKYQEVIDLCKQAKQQGWMGDWEKRIARCKKKLSKV